MRLFLLTLLALVCFAANSVLCRLALAQKQIDPASFTAIRLCSGAVLLSILILLDQSKSREKEGSWLSGFCLFAYACAFSLAYVGIGAGTGALILFGAVQVTMFVGALLEKHEPSVAEWVGVVLAMAGLVYLVLPGLTAPPLGRAALMAVAGVSWGIYSLRGRAAKLPILASAQNFLRSAPFGIVAVLPFIEGLKVSPNGVGLAVTSGAVTSGLGYVIWYAALPELGAVRAAVVQLLVPVLAAAGGVLLLGEKLSERLLVAAAVILAGIGLAVFGRAGAK